MAEIRVNPTRMEMKRINARLTTARRGHKLLKDKQDELMKLFLEVVRQNKALREDIENRIMNVHKSFTLASAVSSPKMLEEALMLPKSECSLEVGYKNMMSVNVPVYNFDIVGSTGGGYNYGFAFTPGELDDAVGELTELLPDMIKLAETEKTAQMLAEEIEKTRRRVNALEYIMIPQYEKTIKTIKMKLDEVERGNTTRLMKVKDLMLEAQLKQKHKGDQADE